MEQEAKGLSHAYVVVTTTRNNLKDLTQPARNKVHKQDIFKQTKTKKKARQS